MKTSALSDWLAQRLQRDGAQPVYRQLQQLLRGAVISGELPAHTRLPSTRLLADELGIARNTVIDVYEQLAVEGCVVTRRGSGTVVADLSTERLVDGRGAAPIAGSPTNSAAAATPGTATARRADPTGSSPSTAQTARGLSGRGRALLVTAGVASRQWGAFMPGVPDVREFPMATWTRLLHRTSRDLGPELLSYAPGGGLMRLREALAQHLRAARSVVCEPEQVILTTGSHQSIDLTLRLLAEPGERVWLEDPCYWGLRSTLASLGADIVPVPVDAEGLCWHDLPTRSEPGAPGTPGIQGVAGRESPRAILVTPSHQYPLGMVMSLARRQALLAYARTHDCWVIEDDYDSEFRYGTRPLPALQSLDEAGRVIYVGSLSKVLFPGLRVGYLVVPPAQADAFAAGSAALYREGQLWQQAALADFIEQGHLVSHIRRLRGLYQQRRQVLLEAIARHFGAPSHPKVPVRGDDAGLHLVLSLPDDVDDVALTARIGEAGVAVRPLSRYHADPDRAPRGLLLGYACVRPEDIGPAFDTVAIHVRTALNRID